MFLTFIPSSPTIYILGGANLSEYFADIHSLLVPLKSSEGFLWAKLIGEDNALRRFSSRTHPSSCCIQNGLYIFSGSFQDVKAVDDAELY
ncbi:hypothetical protein I4U23_030426 [Adineta vaga]|nr:hypothetical protein I4U23_030426 [Adineta vaga]